MKRYLALLLVAFAVLISMSSCLKNGLFGKGKHVWTSVEINGKTYEDELWMHKFARGTGFMCFFQMYGKDSVAFRFNSNISRSDVEYELWIETEGMFELDKWYPIVCSESHARWLDTRKYYNVVNGMMKITAYDDRGNGKFNNESFYRFEGEFLFDATGDKNPENVMKARNGKFSLLAEAIDARP